MENASELRKSLRDEYKHNFVGQGIASLIGVLIAFIASLMMFGWNNWYLLLILYMIFIVGAMTHTQIKRILNKGRL